MNRRAVAEVVAIPSATFLIVGLLPALVALVVCVLVATVFR